MPSPDVPAEFLALERLLAARWSCRAFRSEPVPTAVIERLLTLAQRTPSWCNTQPWQVIVTSGAGTERFRAAMSQAAVTKEPCFDYSPPAEYHGVYRERRRTSGWQLYDAVGVTKGDREASALQMLKNFEFFGAPHVAVITSDSSQGTYGAVDCGLYIDTFLLAAQSLGLGAIAQAALASQSDVVRDHFGLPEGRKVLAGISFGYADTEHPANSYRTERAALEEVVTWVND